MSLIGKSLKEVFKKPSYLILALVVALIIFLISIWLPSRDLIKLVLTSEQFDFSLRIKMLVSSLSLIKTNFTFTSRILVITLSLLGGLNLSMLVFYFKKRVVLQSAAGVSLLGILSGFLGISCAACGSVILFSILGVTATAGFIGVLPFNGMEFGLLGALLPLLSIYLIAKKIQDPLLCQVRRPKSKQ